MGRGGAGRSGAVVLMYCVGEESVFSFKKQSELIN